VKVEELIYREHGFFTGRELYFLDPSGNLLEVRDPTWKAGMATPALADIVGAGSRPRDPATSSARLATERGQGAE
jgi:hypothetical protein